MRPRHLHRAKRFERIRYGIIGACVARRPTTVTALFYSLLLVLGTPSALAAEQVEISVPCNTGIVYDSCKTTAEEWAAKTGNRVRVITVPVSTTEKLALYQQILAAQTDDLDVYDLDVIWPGILGDHFIDLAPHTDGIESGHFETIINNNTYDGRLVALPKRTDAGLLYYRKDLLEKYGASVPETWDEMTQTAQRIQAAERTAGKDKMWGYVFQGKAYEGLSCNALEWIDSFGGGTVVAASGDITINNPRAARALDQAALWVRTISPPGVLNYAEEDARGVFQSGNAVFMRNWPYAWSLSNAEGSSIAGKVGTAPLPRGGEDGKHSGTLGGWQLAVSKYSRHPAIAVSYVLYATSREVQKRDAISMSLLPTIRALYEDEEVITANPFFRELYGTLTSSVARPSSVTGVRYNRVSSQFWNAAHRVMSGRLSGAEAVADLEKRLKRARRRGW